MLLQLDSPDVAVRPTMADPATLTAAKSFFNGGSSSRPPDPYSSKSYAAMVEKKLSSATFTT